MCGTGSRPFGREAPVNQRSTRTILFLYLLFIVGIAVNFRLLLNEIINWRDDELFIALYSISTGASSMFGHDGFSPFMMKLLSLQYAVGGNGYFIYHAVSVLFHTVNAMMLFLLLRRFDTGFFLAGCVALLFAVHPLHIESVAIISHQATVLAGTLLLGMAFAGRRSIDGPDRRWEIVSIVLAAGIAALSGPTLVPLLVIAAVRFASGRVVTFRSIAPFLAVWGIAWIVAVWNASSSQYLWSLFSESVMMVRNGMTVQSLRTLLPWTMTIIPASAVSIVSDSGPAGMVPPFIVLAVVTAAVALRRQFPRFLLAILCIVLPALPLISGIPRGEWIFADEASYLSVIGWSALLIGGIEALMGRFGQKKGWSKAFYAATALLLFSIAVPTLIRSGSWFNGGTFWGKVMEEFPNDSHAAIQKGMFHYFRYETEPAIAAMDAAAAAAPGSYAPYYHRGLVNLGAMFLPAATVDFSKALTIDPTASNAWFGMGSIHMLYSRFDSAIAAYSMAIQYSPGFIEAYVNRGTVYGSKGDFVRAFADFQRAEQLSPGFAQIYGNRALISLQMGDATFASKEIAKELQLEPRNVTARVHSALTSVLLSDTTAAILQFSNAVSIDSLRTALYLDGATKTFLHSKQEKALGAIVTEKVFGKKD